MSKFSKRLTNREFFLLQRQRLVKENPLSLPELSAKNPVPKTEVAPIESLVPILSAPLAQTAQTESPQRSPTVLNAPSRPRKEIKEINLLPRAYQKTPSAFFAPVPESAWPSLAVFLSLCLISLSLFPLFSALEAKRNSAGLVLGEATSAYEQLRKAQDALAVSDFENASGLLATAYTGFGSALEHFQDLGAAASLMAGVPEAKQLLLSAQQATLGLQYATSAVRGFSDVRLGPGGLYSNSGAELDSRLQEVFSNFQTGIEYFEQARGLLAGLDQNRIPEDFRPQVASAQAMLNEVEPALQQFAALRSLLLGFLSEQEKTYLLLFENSRELRATGGFIGTYGLLRAKSGTIKDLKVESIYNPDGQLKVAIAAPGPLQNYLTKTWAMRDSNWFFNFPDSAVKAAEFLKLETGITPDEVVAFTPEIFVRLLSITGPVDMPEYGVTVTLNAENFVDTVQYQTSVAYNRVLNQPKKFLADFTPRFLERMSQLRPEQWVAVLQQFIVALAQKDLLFYSADAGRQQIYASLNWAGAVRDVPGDYLAVVNTSVGAGKTDQEISSDINLTAEFLPSGVQRNTLIIHRSRGQTSEKEFPVNRDFLRVYVPAGSKLISASGFGAENHFVASAPGMQTDPALALWDKNMTAYPEFNAFSGAEAEKTIFAGWLSLAPEQAATVTLVYELPKRYNVTAGALQAYSLFLQKQPGAAATHFESRVRLPALSSVVWVSSPEVATSGDTFRYQGELDTDQAWGLIFSRNSP
ncbi:MAG: DUF4012 domain-containing protein [Patescibacteria group bacterium]|nr:DUF4012 domain-containing protein [Patescibacteria group bacterium]